MYFELNDAETSSFLVTSRFATLEGGTRLVRLTDSTLGHSAALGRFDDRAGIYRSYWMYAGEIEDILDRVSTAGPYGLKAIQEISKRWAISDDWGDLKRAWQLTIPNGHQLQGYCGFAKFQPKVSAPTQLKTGKVSSRSYDGGSMQFVLGLTIEQAQWIEGPIGTLRLSKKKLLCTSGA